MSGVSELLEGSLPPETAEHVAGCAVCARELDALREAFSALGALVAPELPSATLRDRILDAAAPEARFEAFADRVAALCGVARERALELLGCIDDPSRWSRGPGASRMMGLPAGPDAAGQCLFLRIAAGQPFPHHHHLGDERVLVLQGSFVDGETVVRRGQEATQEAGSAHTIRAGTRLDCICLVVQCGGAEFRE